MLVLTSLHYKVHYLLYKKYIYQRDLINTNNFKSIIKRKDTDMYLYINTTLQVCLLSFVIAYIYIL